MTDICEIAKNAKNASVEALSLSTEIKNQVLQEIYNSISENKNRIFDANKNDLKNAEVLLSSGKITQSVYNRLKLDENKMTAILDGILDVIKLEDPINKVFWTKELADNLILKKVSCPIGVIGVIFEARPDVISQIVSLAVKSSNAVILKGGSESTCTNTEIYNAIIQGVNKIKTFPNGMVNLVFSRDDVSQILSQDKYIDLIIPRGSNALVKYIKANTKIPVMGHSDGICHIYIDDEADINKVIPVCVDAKCQYPSACNSVETILIHKNIVSTCLKPLIEVLKENGVIVKCDLPCYMAVGNSAEMASEEDWSMEYCDKIVSVKMVESLYDAVSHINYYGSGHTDCIMTENNKKAEQFMQMVDSAGVYQNVSTRFADGFRYGFGAEVGISTGKIHARGPVGLDGLTTYKYMLTGNGETVNDFVSGNKHFTHKYI